MDREEETRNGDLTRHVSKKPKLNPFISEPEIRDEFSHHQQGVARINNGSFGSCPRSVLAAQKAWQLKFLQQPDDFYFNNLRKGILESRTVIKDLINADDVDEISLVDNATTAAAIVLQQIGRGFSEGKFNENDTVLMLHCAFQAVKKSIQAYVTRAGGSIIEIQLPFPIISEKEIIKEFKKGLEKGKENGKTIRLAIIDHITSMPCVVIPVRKLVQICREEGVEQVFVDAAHAIGSVKIDVKEIGADFYVMVSHEFGNGLPIESAWIGTRDYSAQLVVPSAVKFVNRFEGGTDGIMKRNHEQVLKMGKMLAESWGTNLGSPPEMCAGMVMVGLPSSLKVMNEEDASRLRGHLRVYFGVEVPIYYQVPKDDGEGAAKDKDGIITGYARISHQVYNTLEDYEKFKEAIIGLVEERKVCKMLLSE
ncbi:L-cysteine desulfhydrase-like [Melia azedarach]|uniref:L-cysteine desulfhydrase-like n=1 Tax=Melia azedarach TaxID=155640 RepID=A0ACC1YWR2_MELAZ|nr:L-cysteine desulfhydrase-like [Melia azedarach]